MKKLQLEHLSPYLPYSVKAIFKEKSGSKKKVTGTISCVYSDSTICCYDTVNSSPDEFKLLLKPLSALDEKALSEMNMDMGDQMIIEEIRDKRMGYWSASYDTIQILLKNHYDVFGLIEQGFAEAVK